MDANTQTLIVIAGPTAIGKTALAIQLAKIFDTEIISADSRQFYKELNIGVAKPSPDELASVPHHFIGHISIDTPYTVADYEKDVLVTLENLYKKRKVVILAGGSGLFIDAVVNGLDAMPDKNLEVRETLNNRLEQEGIDGLLTQLEKLDKPTFDTIDKSNPRRVIRALEICISSGKKASEFLQKQHVQRPFETIKIVLDTEREALYNKINQRVDVMMQQGLMAEAQSLISYQNLNALHTVGYKELFEYLEGKQTLEKAIELIKQHTRNYAKRQLTWFRKDSSYTWFSPSQTDEIVAHIQSKMKA